MRRNLPIRLVVLLIVAVLVALFVTACAKPAAPPPPPMGGMGGMMSPPMAPTPGAAGPPGAAKEMASAGKGMAPSAVRASDAAGTPPSPGSPGSTAPPPVPVSDRQVIKTADLTVEVEKVGKAEEAVKALAERAGGWVNDLKSNMDSDNHMHSDITVRVPATQFRTVIDGVSGLGKVKNATESGEDVTMQMVDLDSRIRNLEREEATVLKLYNAATKMDDILKIEEKLSAVRGQIEEAQGRLRKMKDSVSYSTISVHLAEPQVATVPQEQWSVWVQLVSAERASLKHLRGFVDWLLWFVIVDLLWLILVALLVWLIVRWIARSLACASERRGPPPPTVPPSIPPGDVQES